LCSILATKKNRDFATSPCTSSLWLTWTVTALVWRACDRECTRAILAMLFRATIEAEAGGHQVSALPVELE